ncbi:MAG: 3D domain-containing protein [Desulfomonilia bacterium]
MGTHGIRVCILPVALALIVLFSGCATAPQVRRMEVTAYCGCSECCGWERGSWAYAKLDVWNKYVSTGPRAGEPYTGQTASGTRPHIPHPGLFSWDSVTQPWMIPVRIIFFPWLLLPQDGTVAADTRYYPFGTRMYIPDYGWGRVEDRGSAIKGPDRLDVYCFFHSSAERWGRRRVLVKIWPPD